MNVSDLENGSYILMLSGKNYTKSFKLMIAR